MIRRFYLYAFVKNLSFWVPVFTLYLLARGLSYTQIMTLLAIQSVLQIIFELPSGIFADKFGRKAVLAASSVFKCIYGVLVLSAKDFEVFVIAYLFYGMALAFESGADVAFLFDTLKSQDRVHEYRKIEGRAFSYSLLGRAIGGSVGGVMALVSYELPVLASAICFGLAAIVAFTLTEPPTAVSPRHHGYFAHLRETLEYVLAHRRVAWLLVFAAMIHSSTEISFRFLQPYLQEAGIGVSYFGLLYCAWLLISSAASRYAHTLERGLGEAWSLRAMPLLLGASLIIMGTGVHWVGVAGICLGQVVWGIARPITADCINKSIESHHRATLMSLGGILQSILLIVLSPLFGSLADHYHLTVAARWEGLWVVAAGLVLVALVRAQPAKAPARDTASSSA